MKTLYAECTDKWTPDDWLVSSKHVEESIFEIN